MVAMDQKWNAALRMQQQLPGTPFYDIMGRIFAALIPNLISRDHSKSIMKQNDIKN